MIRSRMLLVVATACIIPSAGALGSQRKPATATPARAHPTTAELVQARQAGMHMAATLFFQGVAPRAKGNGALKDVHWSEGLEMWAAAIPGLFPAGSAHSQSRAKREIWTSKADFNAKAKAMGEAAHALTVAGEANDLTAYAAAAARLNQACTACHMAYRGPPPEQ